MKILSLEDLRAELQANKGVGFLLDIAPELYRSHEALSQSELKLISDRSPKHYQHHKRYPRPDSKSMKLGRAAHVAVLQPLLFEESYIRAPKIDKRTRVGKESSEKLEALGKTEKKEVLAHDLYDSAIEIRDSVRENGVISEILSDGVAERACFGELHGMLAKGLLDFYRPNDHHIIDLKSTKCASLKDFEKDIRSYKYHWQVVWYTDLVRVITGKTPRMSIIAVESIPPYSCAIYEIKADLLSIARREMMDAVRLMSECLRTGVYPGYPAQVNQIGAKQWEWEQYRKMLHQELHGMTA